MSGIRVELANPNAYESPKAYVEQHLAPVVTELHRITSELLAPGCTSSEEWSVDMAPSMASDRFSPLDKRLIESSKRVTFDGSGYFSLPKELLRAKQLKVQLSAVVYAKKIGKKCGSVAFRLLRGDGMVIDNSIFQVSTEEAGCVSRILPFGNEKGCVSPEQHDYIIEGRYLDVPTLPVCRRLSLAFVYI